MGRPAKPIEEHKLHGTAPHPPTVRETSAIPEGRPKFGRVPKEERPAFKRICRQLQKRRHLTDADYEIIAMYASADATFWRAKERIAVEGEICQYERLDSNGQPHTFWKENLWVAIYNQAFKDKMACLDRLGLTPRAKDSVKPARPPAEDKPADPLEAALAPQPKIVPFEIADDDDLDD